MSRRRATLIVVAGAVSVSCSSPCLVHQGPSSEFQDIELTSYRSLGGDDAGPLFWLDDKRNGAVTLPPIAPSRVCIQNEDHEPIDVDSDLRETWLELTRPSRWWASPIQQINVFVDGYLAASFHVRQLSEARGEAADFWSRVAEADAMYRSGDHADAFRAWSELEHHPAGPEVRGEISTAQQNMAYLDTVDGHYAEAKTLYSKARAWMSLPGDGSGLADIIMGEAQVDHYAGGYVTALRQYDRSIELVEARDAKRTYAFSVQKALTLAALGRFGEALELVEDPAPDGLNRRWRATLLSNVAWIRFEAMEAGVIPLDVGPLRETHRGVAEIFDELNEPKNAVNQRARVVALDIVEGDYAEARKGLDAIDEMEVPGYARTFVELLRARVEARFGEVESAERRLREITTDDVATINVCRAHELLGDIAEMKGALDDARQRYRQSMACIGVLDERIVRPSAHALLLHARGGAENRLARALARAGQPEEAFLVLDHARAAVLERHIDALIADRHQDAWLTYQTARRAEELARHEGCSMHVATAAVRGCKDALRTLGRASEAAFLEYQRQVGRTTGRVRDTEWLRSIQAELGPERGLLAVSGHGEASLVLLVDAKGVAATTDADPFGALEERLNRLEHLYVVPDWDPRSLDPFSLPGDRRMTFLPHAGVLLRPPAERSGRPIVIADPDGTLPRSAREGTLVAGHLGAETVAHADRAAWLRALREADILHYAGHASGRYGDPWSVTLKLAGGEGLTVFDVLLEPKLPDLVVLDGCATGPSARAGGGGFPAALVQAGVRHVIATTESQQDGAAAAFFDDFYAAREKLGTAEAFRRAVAESRKRGDDTWRVMRLWGR